MSRYFRRALVVCLFLSELVPVDTVVAQATDRILSLPSGQVTAVESVGNTIVVGTSHGWVYASHDQGQTWSSSQLDETTDVYVVNLFASSTGEVYATDPFRGVFISHDNGDTFNRMHVPLLDHILQLSNGHLVASTPWGIRMQTSLDSEWTGELYEWAGTPFVQSSFVTNIGENVLIAGTISGFELNQGELIKSEDLGQSWIDISDTTWREHGTPTVAAFESQCGLLIMGTEDVYLSNVDHARRETPFYALNAIVWEEVLISGGYDGVWKSEDCGENWDLVGFGGSSVYAISVVEQGGYDLLAVGNNNHVDMVDLAMITSATDSEKERPDRIELKKIYPNPVRDKVTIEFVLDEPAQVTVEIYDQLGRRVEVLTSGFFAPGTFDIEWNPTNQANGVYFCRLSAGGLSETVVLVLQR